MKSSSHRNSMQSFDSIVGNATRIEGTLHVDESLRIDGRLNGNLEQQAGKSRWIIIGPTGEIHGDIRAQNVSVAGKVIGNIFATESIELMDGCEVRGNITHRSITVEPGASVHGQLIAREGDEDSQAEAQRAIEVARNGTS
jgi:cytoskeletal protein CcmA (bactofilin family)